MNNLQRSTQAPPSLADFDYNVQSWDDLRETSGALDLVWEALTEMQHGYCCYCESIALEGNRHIEHFFTKGATMAKGSPYKALEFDWNNLFFSCGRRTGETCGHYKDMKGNNGPGIYDPAHLIKPDIDNPSDFFDFCYTGVISVKPNLSLDDKNRANETLRVLNLSHLAHARATKIDHFALELNNLAQKQIDPTELALEIETIKLNIKQSEYQTSILRALF